MAAIYEELYEQLYNLKLSFEEKVDAVYLVWEMFTSYCMQNHREAVSFLAKYLFCDTYQLLLKGEWQTLSPPTQKNFISLLARTLPSLMRIDPQIHRRMINLIKLVNNQWGCPILCKIINDDPSLDPSEALRFFANETPSLITIRLQTLCSSRCECLALPFVSNLLKCLQHPDAKEFSESCSSEHKEYWRDTFIALMYYYSGDDEQTIVPLLELFPVTEGIKLVDRFIRRAENQQNEERVWKNSLKIAQIGCHCYLDRALTRCPPSATSISSLSVQFVKIHQLLDVPSEIVAGLLYHMVFRSKFVTSMHMFILGAVLFREFREMFRPFCIELYVRGGWVELNFLESCRFRAETNVVERMRERMADILSTLSEFLVADAPIHRECLLAAFSQHPTREQYDQMMTNAPTGSEHEESIYTEAAASRLGLTRSFLDDLAIVVENCRSEILRWDLDKNQFSVLCQHYLNNKELVVRPLIAELKFLKIDCSIFDGPRTEVDPDAGIGKGYECYFKVKPEAVKRLSGERGGNGLNKKRKVEKVILKDIRNNRAPLKTYCNKRFNCV